MRYDLAGRTVLITGSTGGLGATLAQTLRARGANLALLDLDQEAVTEQAAELGGDTVARGWVAERSRSPIACRKQRMLPPHTSAALMS